MIRSHPRRLSECSVPGLLACLLVMGLCGLVGSAGAGEPDHVPGEVLIQFRDDASVLGVRQALADRPGQRRVTDRVTRVGTRPGETVEQVILELESLPDVEFAEPNYTRRIQQVPDDPFFDEQWALHNTGQTPRVDGAATGNPGLDIGAVEAWRVTTGDPGLVVAIIDTGIDLSHPDLADNLYRDAEGRVIGADFIDPGTAPEDRQGHGTAMAGVIGARGDNGIGIAGVAWEVSLMPLRALGNDGKGSISQIAAAIEYAVDHGARIINASFGSARTASEVERQAIKAAGERGVLFVAAACNDGEDNDIRDEEGQQSPCYPASYDLPNIVSVAATDNSDALIFESNYGAESVHLGAPGYHILTLRADTDGMSGDSLVYNTGTSVAAAMVSGAAVLLLSHDPVLSPPVLREILMAGADPAENLQGRTLSGGRLNVAGSLELEGAEMQSSASLQSSVGGGGGGGRLGIPGLVALLACIAVRRRLQRWKCAG